MIASSLLGISLLIATVSFAVGVFVAYALWGSRYCIVQDLEASVTISRRKAEALREEQSRLHERLQDS